MISEKIETIFGVSETTLLHENAAYGFCIRAVKIPAQECLLVFTEGVSHYLQPVDEKNGFQRIELYFLLPDYWDLSKKNWPLYWLNRIAQVPKKNKTWFGIGDTLPAGNPPVFIDEQLNCPYFILSEPLALAQQFSGNAWKDTPFNMLAVVPIFEKEFDYKSQNSAKALLQIFEAKNVTEKIDLYRNPVARKRFMGLF